MVKSFYHGFCILILRLESIMYGLNLGEPTYQNCFLEVYYYRLSEYMNTDKDISIARDLIQYLIAGYSPEYRLASNARFQQ
jgi:hypothetical protein